MTDTDLENQYSSEIDEATHAFAAEENKLEGVDLLPYTPDRAWAAQAMGLRYGFVDDAGQAEFNRSNLYPGAVRDCGIVLWLMSISVDAEIDKAARDPIGAAKRAAMWAHEKGFGNPHAPKFWEAYKIFLVTMSDVASSTTIPKN